MCSFVSEDISRDHRSIGITVWYPALRPQESTGRGATRDAPLDLSGAPSSPLEGLEGAIDAEHAGAIGYSFDGYNALALSGAQVDPEFCLAQCAGAPSMEPALDPFRIDYYCRMSSGWNQFADLAGAAITASDDGLWQPMTSPGVCTPATEHADQELGRPITRRSGRSLGAPI